MVKFVGRGMYYRKELVKWHRINEDTFNIWDYGGQVIYHGIHRIFMTSMAVYIVVFNLNVNLDDKAIVMDSSGQMRIHHLTNLEFILYWILSAYIHSRELKVDLKLQIALPAIVLVGTHRDSLGSTEQERISKVKEAFDKIEKALMGKPYEKHVYPTYFDIENNRSEVDGNIAKLKKVLDHLMTALDKPIPLKWMRFRSEIHKLKDTTVVCPLKKVKELAAKFGINEENQQSVLLNFLYDLGEIIYMPDNKVLQEYVVLNPMHFVEMVTTVITVKQPNLESALYKDLYRKLNEGILEEPLFKKLLEDRGVDLKKFDFFVELMRRFCLLCERKAAKPGNRSFFVPLRLALEPSSDDHGRVDNYGERAISIYHDFCGYLPDELFPQLVTEFIDRFQDEEGNEQPKLARDHAELYFDQHHRVIMSAITFGLNRLLRTTILRRERDDGAQEDLEPLPEACKTVLEFLEESFKVSQQGGRRGFQFQRCIPCSICSKHSPKKHIRWLGNFEKAWLPCKDKTMSVIRYKRLFAGTVDSDEQLPEESYAEGSGLEDLDFRGMLMHVSNDIGDDLNKWKVALSDHINPRTLQKAPDAIPLFESLIEKADIKNGDIRILQETIKMTGSLHLRKHIQNFPSLDNIVITHFTPFRQSVMAFGKQLTVDDNRKIVSFYGLRRQYSDGWSLIMDLEQKLILDDNSLGDFKHKLNNNGLERLSNCL
ncbi:uncharacterized protein LOC117111578 isoform X2 [Anneissia japonica]|uniref:uncharacterized protein LOC117111578 isoform X2 n=1 Tax=Anneissia japonica TaxID=1529436 RepID=UPI0014255BD3|nr:uncharacterized protein LOC117111578 isoform X2 [Anneissia japonica]